MELTSGQIVTVDWRRDPLDPSLGPQPPEPNKLRPAVVVQDTGLFDPSYPTVLVVPMTGDAEMAIPDLTCVAKTRIRAVKDSRISPTELQQLRQLIVLAIGGLG